MPQIQPAAATGMTFGSLFAGIGGFDLGLERAGLTCKWQVEIDPWCRAVLQKHWPTVPKFADIRDVRAQTLERVDVLCGGFPCQDVSTAGKRAGIDGARSGLWTEYARLIGELRPRFVLVENVSGLLVHGLGRVLGDLAVLRYDAEWQCVPAAAFGAPQRRTRVWIVAYPGCLTAQVPAARIFTAKQKPERVAWWEVEPGVDRVADGIPHRMDRLCGLGNAVVPQVAEWLGRRLLAAAADPSSVVSHGIPCDSARGSAP